MSLFKKILLVTVAATLIAGCGKKNKETEWGIFHEPIETAILPAATGAKQLAQIWERSVGDAGDKGYAILKPAVDDQSVFVTNRKGLIQRLDLDSGKVIWQNNLKKDTFAGVGIGAGLVLVALDAGIIVALSSETGAQLWTAEIGRQISAIPVAGDNRVIARTADGMLFGLDAEDGTSSWEIQNRVPGLSVHGDSSPLIAGDTVVTGLSNGKVIANAVENGRDFWEIDLSIIRGTNELDQLSDVDSQPLLVEGRLYAATYQGDVVSIDLQTSRVAWRSSISTRLPLEVENGRLYVTDELGQLSAVDAISGLHLWAQPAFQGRGVSNPVGINDRVVIGDANGNIHLLDANDGLLLQSQKISSGAIISLVRTTRGFVAFSVKGGVFAMVIENSP